MPREPLETAKNIRSTGVREVYTALTTATVSVLMNYKTQNDHLWRLLTETYAT